MASTGLVYDAHGQRPGREDDAADPQLAYPASKLAAENQLRASKLNWSILRLGFVYGDDDGHLQSVPKLAGAYKWHPASRLSMIHHRDVATIVRLALEGAMDRRIVNVTDESPMSIYEIAALVGESIPPSSDPLANPWWGQIDGTLARSLGFQPAVATAYQAARENAL
jgi:nucleoside-diphosphate-sugar epimerase